MTALSYLEAKPPILGATSGQQGNELSPERGDMGKVLTGAQLTVGHIEKIFSPQELPQIVKVSAMNRVISSISTIDLVRNGHCAICEDT
ncbi:MAG TPA: hypothetical protein DCP92_09290 [Nitrospiraceae bacterium]|nr:hypothetical protein [Nitrospiraceae bacterium]